MILEGALNKLKEKISTLSQSMIDNIRKNLTEKNRTLKGLEENRDKLLSDIPNIRKKITELDLESKELDKKILDIKERLGVNLLSDIPNTREKITELDLEGNELDKKMDDVKERLGVNL